MSKEPAHRYPIQLAGRAKTDVRTQFGALCWRMVRGKPKVLLITSRDTGRWIIPKGWPMDGHTPSEAAAVEAWEEAGVTGKVSEKMAGVYSYTKPLEQTPLPILVMVFALRVKTCHDDWPEKSQRTRKWMSPRKAALKVNEDELAQLLRRFGEKLG